MAREMNDPRQPPDGIEPRHVHEASGNRVQNLPTGLLGLGVLILGSVIGLFGQEGTLAAEGDAAALQVLAPNRIRNGEFYEMTLRIEVREPVDNLVLEVDEAVWRDVTVNSFFPAPERESFADGAFVFEFGPMEAGTTFVVKVDCQVNPDHPPASNAGTIAVTDDGDAIAGVDYRLEVLP